MMTMKSVDSWAIHAYADGELDTQERAEVEKLLAANPQARMLHMAILEQKRAIKAGFDATLDEAVPDRLRRATSGFLKHATTPVTSIAAAVAMLALGSFGGWFAGHSSYFDNDDRLPNRAFSAHQIFTSETVHPVEIGASNRDYIGKWLSQKIGADFKVPDLGSFGYSFIGGRLLVEDDVPAGLLMYEKPSGSRLTIYVAANQLQNDKPLLIEQKGQLVVCYWLEPDLVYAVVGMEAKETMLPLAKLAHDGFDS